MKSMNIIKIKGVEFTCLALLMHTLSSKEYAVWSNPLFMHAFTIFSLLCYAASILLCLHYAP